MNLNVLGDESKLGNSGPAVGLDEEDAVRHSVIPGTGLPDRKRLHGGAGIQSFWVLTREKTQLLWNGAEFVL